jgi:hypothetical protein
MDCGKIHEAFPGAIQHHSGGPLETLPFDGFYLEFVDQSLSYREKVNGPNPELTGREVQHDRGDKETARPRFAQN